jgi:hypothetical protein
VEGTKGRRPEGASEASHPLLFRGVWGGLGPPQGGWPHKNRRKRKSTSEEEEGGPRKGPTDDDERVLFLFRRFLCLAPDKRGARRAPSLGPGPQGPGRGPDRGRL